MFVSTQEIPSNGKVWIYPSSRKFYADEIEGLKQKIRTFIDQWKLDDVFKASYELLYNRFIIFFADDKNSTLTNVEINEQVTFVLQLQQEYKVELLDKMNVCFKQGKFVQYKELKEFKILIKNKSVSEKTIVFDNLVQTKEEFENFWEVPIAESWYQRFLK